jgi:Zn-finger nucleic acid-binding protein
MQCPKCPGTLEEKTYRKITVPRCSDCGGLWCKPDVLLAMKKEWMSESALDIGDPKLQPGDALASLLGTSTHLDEIKCPEDGTLMEKVADENQTHIWYESCPTCDGMFFDAGEFTDLKFNTLMDRVRDLFKGRRPNT